MILLSLLMLKIVVSAILNKNINVILTTRSKDVGSHPGQVCFPGGKLEKKDKNLINCAKREAFEEVGIKEEQVKILGEIDQCITGTNYQVTPIVASITSTYIPLSLIHI